MAAPVTNYQCPSCTGPLKFSSDRGELVCEYCGQSFEIATIEQLYTSEEQTALTPEKDQSEWDFAMDQWGGEEAEHMRAYTCPSCAAQIICDDTTAATSCPYCNNPTVVPGQFAGMLRPDYIIPFKMDKEAAEIALKKHYKGKKFLPKSFSADNKIEELKGIYVPFWLFDGKSSGNVRYNGTIQSSYTDGDEKVVVTEHYDIARQGDVVFEKLPVDGSAKMPDAHMDAIEPYDYSDLVPFSTGYLPGYLADKYDVVADECSQRANERITNSTQDILAKTIRGYATLTLESANTNIEPGQVRYALLPVWMLNTKWKDKDFLFAMNGQTGKLIGDLPVDWGKFWMWFVGIALPLMVLFGIILF